MFRGARALLGWLSLSGLRHLSASSPLSPAEPLSRLSAPCKHSLATALPAIVLALLLYWGGGGVSAFFVFFQVVLAGLVESGTRAWFHLHRFPTALAMFLLPGSLSIPSHWRSSEEISNVFSSRCFLSTYCAQAWHVSAIGGAA